MPEKKRERLKRFLGIETKNMVSPDGSAIGSSLSSQAPSSSVVHGGLNPSQGSILSHPASQNPPASTPMEHHKASLPGGPKAVSPPSAGIPKSPSTNELLSPPQSSSPVPTSRPSNIVPPQLSTPTASPILSGNNPQADTTTSSSPSAVQKEKREAFFARHPNLSHAIDGTLKLALIAADSSEVPGLTAAVEAIIAFKSFTDRVGEHRAKCEELVNEAAVYSSGLADLLKLSDTTTESWARTIFEKYRDEFLGELETTTKSMNDIQKFMNQPGVTGFFKERWNQGQIADKIQERTEALKRSRDQFMTLILALTSFNTIKTVGHTAQLLHKWDMSRIPCVEAAYNEDEKIGVCYPGTRSNIIIEILAQSSSAPASATVPIASISSVIPSVPTKSKFPLSRVVWVRASAGSGKSTISKSVAQLFVQQKRLAGTFFFSRDVKERRTTKNVFSTFASQLASWNRVFAAALDSAVNQEGKGRAVDPAAQLDELLIGPLNAIDFSLISDQPLVFILDALDECGDDRGEALLKYLLPKIDSFPSQVCFLITSRPESTLSRHLFKLNISGGMCVIDIDDATRADASQRDIYAYLSATLFDILGWSASPNEIQELTTLSDGLFQFAITAVKFITNGRIPPQLALDIVLKIGKDSPTRTGSRLTLDKLYSTVFNYAYPRKEDEDYLVSDDDILPLYRLAVGGVLRVREPVSMKTLADLTGKTEKEVYAALSPLSSVILLPSPQKPNMPIRIRHLSFAEYITNPTGRLAKDHPQFVIDAVVSRNVEETLTTGTFSIMKNELCFNVSNFTSSFLPNNAFPLPYAENTISSSLAYACRFWGSHLESASPLEAKLDSSLPITFMKKNLLFWLEALSIIRAVNTAAASLSSLAEFLETIQSESDLSELKPLVDDAIKFVSYFAPAIARSAPHTYTSTLPFAPISSLVADLYIPDFQNMLSLEIGRLPRWPAEQGMLQGHGNYVNSVAFSPDGKHIASGSSDKTIRIWDAATGETVAGPFEGHDDWVRSVAFSPDGKHIASGSDDKTIRIWDAATGETVAGPFEGHGDYVNSVAFSPDGKHIASGSYNKTIRIWDTSQNSALSLFFNHTTIDIDGWARGPDGQLLFWVPPLHRLSLHRPSTLKIIGPNTTKLNLCSATWGETWAKCYARTACKPFWFSSLT